MAKDEWNECSKHEIKHRGVAGGCPLCLLRTFFEEKQRIGEIGYCMGEEFRKGNVSARRLIVSIKRGIREVKE